MRIRLIALALVVLTSAGQADENSTADDLFAAAVETIEAAQPLGFVARAEAYVDADHKLREILDAHAGSEIAQALSAGRRIGEFDYAAFRTELETIAPFTACAEPESEACIKALFERVRIEVMKIGDPEVPGETAFLEHVSRALEMAKAEIPQIEDPEEKAAVLAFIEEFEARPEIAATAFRTMGLIILAITYSEADMPHEANQLVPAILEEWVKVEFKQTSYLAEVWDMVPKVLAVGEAWVFDGQLDDGFIDDAATTAEYIRDDQERAEVFQEIASAHAENGQIANALKIARRIPDGDEKDDALETIAVAQAEMGKLAEALDIAQQISDGGEKAEALADIAVVQADKGLIDTARQTFTAAVAIADADPEEAESGKLLVSIALEQVRAGLSEDAIETARRTGNGDAVARVLRSIAQKMTLGGEFEEAREIAASIEIGSYRSAAQAHVAEALASAGLFRDAAAISRSIEDTEKRAKVLRHIVTIYRDAGLFDEALQIATLIEDGEKRTQAVMAIVTAHRNFAELDATLLWIDGFADVNLKAKAFDHIASAVGGDGHDLAARSTIDSVVAASRQILGADLGPKERSELLRWIAEAQAHALLFTDAIETTEDIEVAAVRDGSLDHIASHQVNVGDVDQALITVSRVQDFRRKSLRLSQIATEQAKSGEIEVARQTFEAAVAAAALIEPVGGFFGQSLRDRRLRSVAEAQAESGLFAAAAETSAKIVDDLVRTISYITIATVKMDARLFELAFKSATKISRDYERRGALRRILSVLEGAGRLAEALEMVALVEEKEPRARALRQLVEVHAKAGRLDQALQVSALIEIGSSRLKALLDIAKAQAELGHREAARRAFQAAHELNVELQAHPKSLEEIGLFLCVSRAMIAAAQVEAGYFDDAFHTAESGDRACERALGFFAIAGVVSGEDFLD